MLKIKERQFCLFNEISKDIFIKNVSEYILNQACSLDNDLTSENIYEFVEREVNEFEKIKITTEVDLISVLEIKLHIRLRNWNLSEFNWIRNYLVMLEPAKSRIFRIRERLHFQQGGKT